MNIKLLSGGSGGRGRGFACGAPDIPYLVLVLYDKVVYVSTTNDNAGGSICSQGAAAVSDWPIGAPCTFVQDSDNKSILQAGFGFISATYAIFHVINPVGATNIILTVYHKAVNSWVGLDTSAVLNFYGRSVPNGAAVTAWSALYKSIIATPNNKYWHYSTIVIPLATINLAADSVGHIVFGRNPVDADDTLADQSISLEVKAIRIRYS
jgi:hypothetical protein